MSEILTLLLIMFSLESAFGAPMARTELPLSEFADTEVTTNFAFSAWEPRQRQFAYELAFEATPSNNFEVAFGRGDNGVLSRAEADFIVGWDCGEWFMQNVSNGVRVTSVPVSADAAQTLRCTLATKSDGTRKSFTATVGTNDVFGSVSSKLPDWVYDTRWNLVRLTARGVGDPASRFWVRTSPIGFHLVFR